MSLYQQLKERLQGRSYTGYFSSVCPFHNDHSPSMLVFGGGRFLCLTCRTTGTHQFLANRLKIIHTPIIKNSNILPRWKSWESQWGDLYGIVSHAHEMLSFYPQYMGYYRTRKLDKFVNVGNFGMLDEWAVFPVYDKSGQLVDTIVRSTGGKGDTRYVVHPSDGTRPLYSPNWKRVLENDTVFIVFGILDTWALEDIELPCITSLSGKSVNLESIKVLNKRGVFVPDDGEVAEAHMYANALGWKYKVRSVQYPDGCKDPDEIRRHFGSELLKTLLTA